MTVNRMLACLLFLVLLSTTSLFSCSEELSEGPADTVDAGVDAGADGADAPADLEPEDGGDDAADGEPDGSDPGADPVPDGGDEEGDDAVDGGGDGAADPEPPDGGDGGDDVADGGDDTADGGDAAGDPGCETGEPFDYTCTPEDPDTCPGGICLLGMCLAPVLNEDRWDDCGNDLCDPCETAELCPADCGTRPEMTGAKEYDNSTTMTVWVHGFYNKSADEIANMVYGGTKSCSGLVGEFATYGVDRPCGNASPGDTAPDQVVGMEYYGAIPAAWMTPEDIDEIEQYPYYGVTALERYALIVAKYIRHKLTISGATHVNLCCHSMGCLLIRHMIENDIEGLAGENRFVRWFSSAGVIAGARLARLYDNPSVQEWAPLLGLELNDFVIMHPDFVQDHTCVWDHRLHEGNSPYLGDMILHHATSTDPHIQDALGIALLDFNNPDDEPNDGIMYTLDEYFHSQRPEAAFQTPGGQVLQPTRNAVYVDHMTLPGTDAAALLATASLFHRRKVFITLSEILLTNDREHHDFGDGEQGAPPAEIIAEVEVRYNPYVQNTFGKNVLVHLTEIEHRSPEMFTLDQDTVAQPGYPIYAGPVFDEMTELHLKFLLLEVDWYKRMGVFEWPFDFYELLYTFDEQVPLVDGTIERENVYVRIQLQVQVVNLY